MDGSGKIIWARHNEIQTVNVKSLGAEHEVRHCVHISLPCLCQMAAGQLLEPCAGHVLGLQSCTTYLQPFSSR